MATNNHSRWSTCPLQCHSKIFLGSHDRQITFSHHAALVGNRLKRQAGVLRKLASTSLGYDHHTLHATYIMTGCSKVKNSESLRLLWISNSTLENPERSQRYVGRANTGQLCTTPVEAILAEANLPSIKTWAIELISITMDKSLRTTVTNPRHTTVTQQVRQRTQKPR